MTYPVNEKIAQAMLAQLRTIATAAGYNYTLESVRRPRRANDYSPWHLRAVLTQDDPQEAEAAFGRRCWTQEFYVNVFVLLAEEDETPLETVLNTVRADVEKALMIDPIWGGMADATTIRPPVTWSAGDGTFEGITVVAEVAYAHELGNPFA